MFTEMTIEKLKYYVYMLVDPRNNKPFYIGKGKGNRVFQHEIGALKAPDENLKNTTISEILKNNNSVISYIIKDGLTESEALLVEQVLIDIVPELANLVKGYHSDLILTHELELNYQAKECNVPNNMVLINVKQLFRYNMTDEEMYEATRKWWKIGKGQLNRIKYASCVYNGIIRAVYEVKKWENGQDNEQGRIAFVGKEDVLSHYKNCSVSKYFPQGSQNPIRYGDKTKKEMLQDFLDFFSSKYKQENIIQLCRDSSCYLPLDEKISDVESKCYEFIEELRYYDLIDNNYIETLERAEMLESYSKDKNENQLQLIINCNNFDIIKALLTYEHRADHFDNGKLLNNTFASGKLNLLIKKLITTI